MKHVIFVRLLESRPIRAIVLTRRLSGDETRVRIRGSHHFRRPRAASQQHRRHLPPSNKIQGDRIDILYLRRLVIDIDILRV